MIALFFLFIACETEATGYSLNCDMPAPALAPADGAPGATIIATGNAYTEVHDTVVTVGGEAASVLDVERADCDACDECRVNAGCTSCDDCDDCASDCLTCVETVSFAVPDLPTGAYPVTVTNLHGQSANAAFAVTAAPVTDDTGDTGDTGDAENTEDTGDTSALCGSGGSGAPAETGDTAEPPQGGA